MACQKFASSNRGRIFYGLGLSVVTSRGPCLGITYYSGQVLTSKCFSLNSKAPAGYDGHCLYAGEIYTIETVDDSFCTGCIDPETKYDCLNGGCITALSYNTPGVFASLAACQSGCAKNSNCTGECVPTADIAALEGAAARLISRYCK